MPQGACRGYGTIRPATPTDCRYAESIHHICHTGDRPAASRASKTHVSGLGPPWRSHPCIEGYPQCHRVRAVGMERSDRQHQPIADTQSRFTVYVTGLLPAEPPKRIFRVSHTPSLLVAPGYTNGGYFLNSYISPTFGFRLGRNFSPR